MSVVRNIITKLDREIKQNEMKKTAERKGKLEKEEAERLAAQKRGDFDLEREKIIESNTQ